MSLEIIYYSVLIHFTAFIFTERAGPFVDGRWKMEDATNSDTLGL